MHQLVKGDRNEKIDGKQSLNVVKSRAEKVEGRYAARAGAEIHHVAGEKWVGEAGSNAAIKAPGGFISLHDGGVTIVGTMVWINERGEPGDAEVAEPEQPFDKKEPEAAPPEVKVDSAGMSDTMSDPEYAEGIANPEDL